MVPEPVPASQLIAPVLLVRTRHSGLTLHPGAECRIGRSMSAHIVLDDLRVSWRHAVVREDAGTWVLEDLGSTNGTWAAGERVSRVEIRGVLVVHLGDAEEGPVIRFEALDQASPPVPGQAPAAQAPASGAPDQAQGAMGEARGSPDEAPDVPDGAASPPQSAVPDQEVVPDGAPDVPDGAASPPQPAVPDQEVVPDEAPDVPDGAASPPQPAVPDQEVVPDQADVPDRMAGPAEAVQEYPPPWAYPGSPSPAVTGQPGGPGQAALEYPPPWPYPGSPPYPPGAPGPAVPAVAYPQPQQHLRGLCPDSVRVGETFSVLAGVVRDTTGNAAPRPLYGGPGGQDILLVLHAPGFQVLSGERQVVRVPPDGDSDPVMFELRAGSPGPHQLSITAWLGGAYLGELLIETSAVRYRLRRGQHHGVMVPIDTTPAEGAVSLVVRYDPVQDTYGFEFRDDDNSEEIRGHLAYEPGPAVERLVTGLDWLAMGRAGYSASEARDYLISAGAGLWRELIPARLREQFWARRDRIGQLTILADRDAVPWELLYPLDPGHDAGFLVEQFPVARATFGRRPSRSLSLSPAWFVLPEGSPPQAREEIEALRALLDPATPWDPVIGALPPLLQLVRTGDFGLLHFACDGASGPAGGPAISLDGQQFTPAQIAAAATGQVLARSAPTVFINACRGAGDSPSYQQLDGWARTFLQVGAAAFIGPAWAVRPWAAREFASELYGQLQDGATLGEAAMRARQVAAGEPGDPTWLAYAVYGDPRATAR